MQGTLGHGARLEWLPLESIAHSGCIAQNHAKFQLANDAEMIGWDLLALGLPAADEAFSAGRFEQHLELPGVWLERGVIDSADTRLLQSPLGLAGRSTLLTLWFASGQPMASARVDALVEAAREHVPAHDAGAVVAGVTALQQRVIVLRALAHRVEPAMALAQAVRAPARHGVAAAAHGARVAQRSAVHLLRASRARAAQLQDVDLRLDREVTWCLSGFLVERDRPLLAAGGHRRCLEDARCRSDLQP